MGKSLFVYQVAVAVSGQVSVHEVTAAYMVEEGSMIMLKDEGHAVVFAAATMYVLSVVREFKGEPCISEVSR